ncbi:MAG: DUF3021 family protein, partial [Clostridia bacterium]|nr:DUF3021 family protein [Clostridia bacterium]
MNKYVKEFFHRGLVFGGFGPIVVSIILLIINAAGEAVTLTAKDYFTSTVSIYLLAFVHAGASVFNQIEHWSLPKSVFFHFSSLYIVYSLCYIINSWIPFEPKVLLIFTAVFVAVYIAV